MAGAVLTFGEGSPIAPRPRGPSGPAGQIPLTASYLYFQSYAFQTTASGGHNSRQFSVLCGDDPPTIIDGYGQWTVISRPLRQGLTIPQGFNPAKLQLNVRFGVWDGRFGFGGWDTGLRVGASFDTRVGEYIEECIDDLHWMAGGNELGGPSPVLYIDSYRLDKGQAVRTFLMPKQYRGVPWIIDNGITWGTSLRDRYGTRIYQEAAFTVMGYTAPAGGNRPPVQQSRLSGGFFKTNGQVRTARGIAASNSSGGLSGALVESLARNILKDARNNPCRGSRIKLERRSIDWKINDGIDVWVPSHTA